MFRVNCGCIHILDEEGYEMENVIVRKEIAKFAIDLEIEMSKKDIKYGKDGNKYELSFLIDHLKSEREEVDKELSESNNDNQPRPNLHDELVHEAIMAMMVSNKIKELRG